MRRLKNSEVASDISCLQILYRGSKVLPEKKDVVVVIVVVVEVVLTLISLIYLHFHAKEIDVTTAVLMGVQVF
jgi:hypothetical protein